MTFTLTITLGNEAMQTRADVAASLAELAESMTSGRFAHIPLDPRTSGGQLLDVNGNAIGTWEVLS